MFASGLVAGLAAPAGAAVATGTFTGVKCTTSPNVGTQAQDIPYSVSSPTTVTPNTDFTITFPSGSAPLPAKVLGVVNVLSYSHLATSYQVVGGTFNQGSETADGPTTIDGAATPSTVTYPAADTIKFDTTGPIAPGVLATPNRMVTVHAGATAMYIIEKVLTTTVAIGATPPGISVTATCAVPAKTLIAINDTTPPVAKITALGSVTLGTKITTNWSATDAGGVANFDVQDRSASWNGSFGSWATWKAATTATSGAFVTTSGHTVCFRVRALDTSGNLSGWTGQTCTAVPLRADQLTYSTGWTKTLTSAAYGGVQYSTKTHGKTMSRTGIHAKRVFLVLEKCASCGTVQVRFNGVLVATVIATHATTVHKQVVPVASWSTIHTGTLLVTVTGPTGKLIAIEGVGIYAA